MESLGDVSSKVVIGVFFSRVRAHGEGFESVLDGVEFKGVSPVLHVCSGAHMEQGARPDRDGAGFIRGGGSVGYSAFEGEGSEICEGLLPEAGQGREAVSVGFAHVFNGYGG